LPPVPDESTAGASPRPSTRRRLSWILAGVVALLVLAVIVTRWAAGHDNWIDAADFGPATYVTIGLLVFGDAVIPILPGETTINAAATVAAEGNLVLGWVIVAAAAGAIIGDSTLYWIARAGSRRFGAHFDRALHNPRVEQVFALLGRRAGLLLVAGRYIPGARFAINASLGITAYPYPRFVAWSALGGALWAAYTAVLAYLVATALAGFPLASIVISGAITTTAIAVVIANLRRSERRPAEGAVAVGDAAEPAARAES
jgi:membrane protein DedA with SNARE-associated domain